MDDPRSPNTGYEDAASFDKHWPLTAVQAGVVTLDGWLNRLKASARQVQECDLTFYPDRRNYYVHLKNFLRSLVPVRYPD